MARVKAVLRRAGSSNIFSNDFLLNENHLTATFKRNVIVFTSIEFQLLKLLANKPGRIFTREQLMQNMYSDDRIVNNRTIDSHIKKLRKKLIIISEGEDLIQSVYGAGYRLVLA